LSGFEDRWNKVEPIPFSHRDQPPHRRAKSFRPKPNVQLCALEKRKLMVTWVKCTAVDGSVVYLNLARAQALFPPADGKTTCVVFGGEDAYEVMESPSDLIGADEEAAPTAGVSYGGGRMSPRFENDGGGRPESESRGADSLTRRNMRSIA
jgi:hypothetical protein